MNRLKPLFRYFQILLVICAATFGYGCGTLPTSSQVGESLGQQPLDVIEPSNLNDPRMEAIYQTLVGEIAITRKNPEVALAAYMSLLDKTNTIGAARRATRVALFAEKREEAVVAAKEWVKRSPDEFEARKTLVELLVEEESYGELLPHLQRLVDIAESGRGEGYAIVSTLLSKARDVDASVDVFSELLQGHKDNVYANYHFVRYAVERDRSSKALTSSRRLVKLRPEWDEALKLDAQANILAGFPDQALASFGKLLEGSPDSWRLHLDYIFLQIQANRRAPAFEQLQSFYRQFADTPEAVYQASRAAIELEQYEFATKLLTQLIREDERINESNFWLGRIEEEQGRSESAIEKYALVQEGQFYIEASSRIAALLAKDGLVDEAHNQMVAIREKRPDMSVQLYLFEVEYLRDEKAFPRAKALLDDAVSEHSDNLELRYSRALIAERLDMLDLLESDLRFIIDADPQSAHALNALGYTLADKTDRLDEAQELIEKAFELSPDDFAIIDSMGWLHFRLGNIETALSFLKQAYQASNDAEIAAHLVEVLWHSGETDKAAQILSDSLEQNPDSETLMDTKRKLSL